MEFRTRLFLPRAANPPPHASIRRASSTWKHDTRRFGPANALDGSSDAAWKSAPSEGNDPSAYYEVHFHRDVDVRELRLQFQGGFAGGDCVAYLRRTDRSDDDEGGPPRDDARDGDGWEEFDELFVDPADSNEVQAFPVERDPDEAVEFCRSLRIEFGRSADFYGRIVVYSLEVWGFEG